MFKHILIPTDGADPSAGAVPKILRFAKEAGARVTGIHVMPEFKVITTQSEMLEDTREQYEAACTKRAEAALAIIRRQADEAGVTCETVCVTSDHPYEEIIKAARSRECDLVAMASHGFRGIKGFLLGSETQKVLTHSDIPVLVFR